MPRRVFFRTDAKKIGKILKAGIDTKGKRVAEIWAQGIVQVMAETAEGGARYYYPGLGWTRASLPGRPPAIQTGQYARSIQVRRRGRGPRWVVGSPLMVGRWSLSELLERGTENMAPRPHFEQGYRRNKTAIDREMRRPLTAKERHFG